jgi:stearoyl-CoA desaturase (delta-9 desaturase)
MPTKPINWLNTLFLGTTLFLTLTAVPAYLFFFGLPLWLLALSAFFLIATGMSITLGYHRLFSHLTFKCHPIVKWFTLLFGAAAFEGSAMVWCADHRRHHKHVDEEEDPYDINKGFFHAHIGWLLFRHGPDTPLTWVRDLQKDKDLLFQHRHYVLIAILMSFLLPTVIGFLLGSWIGALGGFLLAGVARVVVVHHMTFCINSLCHWIGNRPYSGTCSARDSFLMALFTFGEGYHNYHHEFQYDYRNGVRKWQWDPTKWTIWALNKLGLASNLRTVPDEKIMKAMIAERERQLFGQPVKSIDELPAALAAARTQLQAKLEHWEQIVAEYRIALEKRREISRQQYREVLDRRMKATAELREAIRLWFEQAQSFQLCPPAAAA